MSHVPLSDLESAGFVQNQLTNMLCKRDDDTAPDFFLGTILPSGGNLLVKAMVEWKHMLAYVTRWLTLEPSGAYFMPTDKFDNPIPRPAFAAGTVFTVNGFIVAAVAHGHALDLGVYAFTPATPGAWRYDAKWSDALRGYNANTLGGHLLERGRMAAVVVARRFVTDVLKEAYDFA